MKRCDVVMLHRYKRIIPLIISVAVTFASAHAQELVLRSSVINSGADQSKGTTSRSSGSLILYSTIGQTAPGLTRDGDNVVEGGFWPGLPDIAGPVAVPVAVPDTFETDEDQPVTIDVTANDVDPGGGDLTIVGYGQGKYGSVSVTDSAMLVYEPEPDFNGQDVFTYQIQNDAGGLAFTTATIVVHPVNDTPIFTSTPIEVAVVGEEYRYTVTALDVDGHRVTFFDTVVPDWLELTAETDTSAILAGTPAPADTGLHDVELTVRDNILFSKQNFPIRVTGNVPDRPTLWLPEDGSTTVSANIEFVWSATEGASSYDLVWSRVADFSSDTGGMSGVLDTTYIATLSQSTEYYWYVVAINGIGQGAPSDTFRVLTGTVVSVEHTSGLPTSFELHQNYPNPFNADRVGTTIAYAVPESSPIRLVVFDLYGREVKTLIDERQSAGRHSVTFDAGNLATGAYFYRLEGPSWQETRQFIVLR